MDGNGARVELRRVSKTFGATTALDDVSVTVEAGTIHALVGENGAGKSTLGKIIGGVYVLDSGALLVDGADVGRWDPAKALATGIATIQQELSLVPALSVAENVFLGIESARYGLLRGSAQARYEALDARIGFGIPGTRPVGELRLADQQKVEILRALARDARLLVLDEPTSSLSRDESDRLHNMMRSLRDDGRTLVYVSHFLDEVLAVADTVTVMRDGKIVRTGAARDTSKGTLIEGMLGRRLEMNFPALPAVRRDAPVVYSAQRICGDVPQDVTLQVREGEILGIAGLVGAGRTELARIITGVDPLHGGTHSLDGRPLPPLAPAEAIRRGIVMLPEDRRGLGLIMSQNVRENITLPTLRDFRERGHVARRRERAAAAAGIERLGIVPKRVDGELRHYSGGNQQKTLFAKWTLASPRLIVLDEPTRGVDIGAKQGIYEAIMNLAGAGTAVVLISSELEEVVNMSHRLVLMAGGRIIGDADRAEVTVDAVLERLFGHLETKIAGVG